MFWKETTLLGTEMTVRDTLPKSGRLREKRWGLEILIIQVCPDPDKTIWRRIRHILIIFLNSKEKDWQACMKKNTAYL